MKSKHFLRHFLRLKTRGSIIQNTAYTFLNKMKSPHKVSYNKKEKTKIIPVSIFGSQPGKHVTNVEQISKSE